MHKYFLVVSESTNKLRLRLLKRGEGEKKCNRSGASRRRGSRETTQRTRGAGRSARATTVNNSEGE